MKKIFWKIILKRDAHFKSGWKVDLKYGIEKLTPVQQGLVIAEGLFAAKCIRIFGGWNCG